MTTLKQAYEQTLVKLKSDIVECLNTQVYLPLMVLSVIEPVVPAQAITDFNHISFKTTNLTKLNPFFNLVIEVEQWDIKILMNKLEMSDANNINPNQLIHTPPEQVGFQSSYFDEQYMMLSDILPLLESVKSTVDKDEFNLFKDNLNKLSLGIDKLRLLSSSWVKKRENNYLLDGQSN